MFKKVSVAVSAALFSTSVFALAPTVTPDIEIFMSGASAQDKAIEALFADICVAGTLDTYKDGGVGKAHSAYFCNVDSSQITGGTTLVNPAVLFHKRSAGGSAMGVNPVIDEQAIDAMAINNGNCTNTAGTNWSCTITNPGDLVSVVSDAGVSDVNPEMFIGENTPAGSAAVNPAVVAAKMEVRPAAALVFGIPVTTNLRDALQEVQGLVVGAEDEANMPSLTKAQVASIMSGKVKKWNQFMVGGVALTSAVSNPPSNTNVNICRRVNGSGTQAQMNAKFLNYPCTAGATAPASTGNNFLGPVITLNSGSGDVETCLDSAAALNRWGIGVQSTEKNVNNSHAYRFVKIDGVAPTIENAAKGKYMDWAENTFQWRVAGALPLTGDKLNIVSTIATNAASPATIRDVVNPGFGYTWGQGGYLALSSNGFAASFPFDSLNPVMPYTHSNGGGLDNCRSPVMVNNSDL